MRRDGRPVDPMLGGVWWKAQLIVFNDRDPIDWYSMNTRDRLWLKKETDSFLNELTLECNQ